MDLGRDAALKVLAQDRTARGVILQLDEALPDACKKTMQETMQENSVIDLFCGAGGLAYGLSSAGLRIAAGIDLDPACRFPFETNVRAPFIEADVSALSADVVRDLFGSSKIRILAGCAPCQPFSGFAATRKSPDDRWRLLYSFLRIVDEVRPEVCTIENVSRLARLPLWEEIVSGLYELGYHLDWRVVDCSHFGVPQKRMRLVLLASNLGPIQLPHGKRGSGPTVQATIGGLPSLEAGRSHNLDRWHTARALTPMNLARIRTSAPGRTWRDWPEDIRVECHKRSGGKTYPSVYGRMAWDKTAPTITTQFYGFGNGRFGHPEQDRALSIREAALLQTFPPDFSFAKDDSAINFRVIGRLIGNAVPPRLGMAIGRAIQEHLMTIAPVGSAASDNLPARDSDRHS